jgi:transposase-like protein
MKTKERLEARRLRVEEQLSLKDIAKRLDVAKGSVSLWVRDLPLSPETVRDRCLKGRIKGGEVRAERTRAIRIRYQRAGRDLALRHQTNPLFAAGCAMYWAEGRKSKNSANICNTDPHFLRLWVRFVKQFFDVQPSEFCLSINCHLDNGKTQRQIETYWLKQLDLPKSCLRNTTIKQPISDAKKNRHPYGVATVMVHSTKIVQHIWGGIKFLGNIDDENRWLDDARTLHH